MLQCSLDQTKVLRRQNLEGCRPAVRFVHCAKPSEEVDGAEAHQSSAQQTLFPRGPHGGVPFWIPWPKEAFLGIHMKVTYRPAITLILKIVPRSCKQTNKQMCNCTSNRTWSLGFMNKEKQVSSHLPETCRLHVGGFSRALRSCCMIQNDWQPLWARRKGMGGAGEWLGPVPASHQVDFNRLWLPKKKENCMRPKNYFLLLPYPNFGKES